MARPANRRSQRVFFHCLTIRFPAEATGSNSFPPPSLRFTRLLLRPMRSVAQFPVIPSQADIVRRSIVRLLSSAAIAAVAATVIANRARAQTTVSLLDYQTAVPAKWAPRAPASTMRLAEYVVPADAQGSAEVVVYFFGKGQGGNVDANLTRWKAQFSTPDGSPVPEAIVRDSTGKFPITFAEYRGNYRRGIGMGSPDSVRTGQTLIAGIAETPRGTLFIQLFGNSARVAEEKPAFLQFVRGLH